MPLLYETASDIFLDERDIIVPTAKHRDTTSDHLLDRAISDWGTQQEHPLA